ncbi:hypothetical protein C7S20_08965 [Christiangramia fulva]|uniref:Uncharacterized protein n=1 Tax=Christiangramia fulva TaxID=2126553 RepID=A0A2R3Z547_9FLAO|nr:DUF6090 family protein [Christiangramia fulva]AVR45390.1 hypothetical protein C7S20_08965 [Christiangramia fulva]
MAKFFNKIRKKLLTQGKTINYLKYAIGEIILVVIGILIALQVNNWNEQRKLSLERTELINSLISDLKTSRQRLKKMKAKNDNSIDLSSKFLSVSYLDTNSVSIDSLKYYLSGIFDFAYYQPVLTTYEQAVSSGSIGLMEDKGFYNSMSDFLTSYERYEAEATLSGQIFYQGSIWELRKEIGNIVALAGEYRSRNGTRKIEPDAYKLSDSEYREFIKKPEVFAAVDNMRTIFYNVNESFRDMDVAAKDLIEKLETIK